VPDPATRIIKNMPNLLRFASLAACLTAAAPAFATSTTFAQYVQTNGASQDISIVTSTLNNTTTTTFSTNDQVYLSFSGVGALPFSGPELATLKITASTTQLGNCGSACGTGDNFNEQGYSGSFSFIDNAADPGANLLSGTFAINGSAATSGAQFSSNVGAGSASFKASATAEDLQQLVFTSDFIAFPNSTNESASFSLSSLIPDFATGTVTPADQAYIANGTLNAAATGTFSSNPAPVSNIPEPASMALLGGGMVVLGLVRRHRAR
jgi:hypothetical protein